MQHGYIWVSRSWMQQVLVLVQTWCFRAYMGWCSPDSDMLSKTTSPGPSRLLLLFRRELGAVAAAAALSLAVPQAAQAVVKGYEPMEAIKGKDYGKERQR